MVRFVLSAMIPLAVLASAGLASAQTIYTWNNTGTDWATAGDWTPAGVPTALDTALFDPNGSAPGTPVLNPTITGPQTALSLTTALNQNSGGWTFGGTAADTLTLAGAGSTGLTTYGPQTTTFNGPALQGVDATNALNIRVTSGSTLSLAGNSAVTANQGFINVNGGRFVMDNSVVNNTSRIQVVVTGSSTTPGAIKQQGGGTFELIGNAAGGTYNVGTYNVQDNSVGGVNTIRVTSNSTTANTVLNFANTGSVSLRQGTRNATVFSSNGELGSANGPRITFVGTPLLSSGVFANSAATPGFAIVNDALGVNFATYSATAGVGVQSLSSPSQTSAAVTAATTAAQLQAFTAAGASGTNGQFNAPANATVTATANIPGQTLRISPAGAGSVLDMATFNLTPAAVMLDGANDFTVSGTGTLFAGTHYLYVNNPNATLNLSLTLTTAANAVVYAGPGFLNLTGTGNQNLATTQRIGVYGGVLRANAAQIGFSGASQGILNLMGGVLEIKNGTNGTGAGADFTRPLGATSSATAGVVNFNSATAEQGSGGFSAFGAPASVNIGGASANLQWTQANFVGDGYALTFGSTKSNAVLRFENPLQLDSGTAPYQPREVRVTAGTGGDKTVLSGAVTGTAAADLVKTGTGVLELDGANTYAGNTLVQAGTLAGNGSLTPATTGGSVRVATGATLNPGAYAAATAPGTLAVATSVTLLSGASFRVRITDASASGLPNSGSSSGLTPTAGANNGFLSVTGAGSALTIPDTTNVVVDGTNTTFLPLTTYSYAVAQAPAVSGLAAPITSPGQFTFVGFGAAPSAYNLSTSGGTVYLNFTTAAVPEPGTILGFGAAGLGLAGWIRRRRYCPIHPHTAAGKCVGPWDLEPLDHATVIAIDPRRSRTPTSSRSTPTCWHGRTLQRIMGKTGRA